MCSDWHSAGYHSIAVHGLLILWWIPTAGKQKPLRFTFCATRAGRSEGGFLSQHWTGLNVFAAKLSITSACGGGVTEKDGEKEENRGGIVCKGHSGNYKESDWTRQRAKRTISIFGIHPFLMAFHLLNIVLFFSTKLHLFIKTVKAAEGCNTTRPDLILQSRQTPCWLRTHPAP